MFTASLGILAALAFVLGLIALAVWVIKRVGVGSLGGRSQLPVEVVQRLPLGPKSGLAVVRVGEKVMVVSMGEGGVHTLCDVDEADRLRVIAGSQLAIPLASSDAASQAFGGAAPLHGWRRVFGGHAARTTTIAPSRRAACGASASVPSAVVADVFASSARTSDATLSSAPVPFGQSLSAAMQAPAPVSTDLRTVLSMTLAPSTRLLGLLALAALGAFASPSAASAQPGEISPIPVIQSPPAFDPVPVNPTAGAPVVAQPVAAAAVQTQPVQPPATQTQGAQPRANGAPAQNVAGVDPAQAAPTAPVGVDEALGALVPQLDLRVGSGEAGELRMNGTVGIVLMMGLMTLVPTLLLMMTGFTRILIVLHFLKQAMGTQSAPPAHLVAGLALLLTGFVMAPTITEANRTAIQPWLAGDIQQVEMLKTGVLPFREFMLRQTNEKDLRTFVEMSRIEQPDTPDDLPLHVLMSAFVASELRTAFQIGFAIYLPFIVIDAVVASVLMAMGMFMLPPAMISLPFKLLLFVLVDGWSLTIQSLVQSFR